MIVTIETERVEIGASDLVALAKAKSTWFQAMCDLWAMRTGDNPVEVAIAVERIDRETRKWENIPIYAFALWATCIFTILAVTWGPSPDTFTYWLLHAIVPGLILDIVITLYAIYRIRGYEAVEKSYWGRNSFGPDLSFFFNESGTRPQDYDPDKGLVQFRGPAREILIKYCLAVVTLEKMDRKECPSDWGADIDAKRSEAKKVHAKLWRLSIANNAFDEEYRLAERRYEVAKKPVVQS